VRYSTKI